VIVCMADDLGWGSVGCNGNEVIRTPHLDAIAREGVRFDRFYSAAPVCSPTRASCLTGRHPYRTGVFSANVGFLRPEEVYLAEVLRGRGEGLQPRRGEAPRGLQPAVAARLRAAGRGAGAGRRLAATAALRERPFERSGAIGFVHGSQVAWNGARFKYYRKRERESRFDLLDDPLEAHDLSEERPGEE